MIPFVKIVLLWLIRVVSSISGFPYSHTVVCRDVVDRKHLRLKSLDAQPDVWLSEFLYFEAIKVELFYACILLPMPSESVTTRCFQGTCYSVSCTKCRFVLLTVMQKVCNSV